MFVFKMANLHHILCSKCSKLKYKPIQYKPTGFNSYTSCEKWCFYAVHVESDESYEEVWPNVTS